MKYVLLLTLIAACSTTKTLRTPSSDAQKKLKCVEYSQTNSYGVNLADATKKLQEGKDLKYPNLENIGGGTALGCQQKYIDLYEIDDQKYRTGLELLADQSGSYCIYNTVKELNEGEYPYGYVCNKEGSSPSLRSEVEFESKVENEGTLIVTGAVAKNFWDSMSKVKVIKPSQYVPHPVKETKSLRCYDYSTDNKGFACYLKFEDMKNGLLGEF